MTRLTETELSILRSLIAKHEANPTPETYADVVDFVRLGGPVPKKQNINLQYCKLLAGLV